MSARGNAAKAYDAYVANWIAEHGPVVDLTIWSMWDDEGKAIGSAMSGLPDSGFMGKVYGRYQIVVLADGRAVERSADTRGNWIYVVFPSLEAAQGYKRPQTMQEMYGWW